MKPITPQQAENEAYVAARRAEIAPAVRFVMGTPEGEKFIGYILDFCGVYRDSMPLDGNDNVWKFQEGRRSVGNEIVALLVRAPASFKRESMNLITTLAEGRNIE